MIHFWKWRTTCILLLLWFLWCDQSGGFQPDSVANWKRLIANKLFLENENQFKVFCHLVLTLLWFIKCSKIWRILWSILSFLVSHMEFQLRSRSNKTLLLQLNWIRRKRDHKKALLYPNEWRPREVFYGFVYVPLFSIYGEIFNGERNSYGHAESLEPGEDCVITTNKVYLRSNFRSNHG